MSPAEEKLLLQRVANGDEAAFAVLMDSYSPMLYTHVLRLTRSRETAEELVQDVFIQIWQTREVLHDVRNFGGYLFILSRNYGINALNKIVRERMNLRYWREEQANSESYQSENFPAENLIDQALATLSTQQQKVWVMSRRLRLKYEDIATELGISKDAVNKYLQTATRKITTYLQQHVNDFFWLAGYFVINFF